MPGAAAMDGQNLIDDPIRSARRSPAPANHGCRKSKRFSLSRNCHLPSHSR